MEKNTRILIGSAIGIVVIVAAYVGWQIIVGAWGVNHVTAANAWEDVLKACAKSNHQHRQHGLFGPIQ